MTCLLDCNSTSGKKYDLLAESDSSHVLNDGTDTRDSDSLSLEIKEAKLLNANLWRRTGCRLMEGQGFAADQEERAVVASKLKRAIGICVVFLVFEVIGGYLAGSLAVLADATHMLSDVAGFAISLLALRASGWLATSQHTFGYFRLEVLGAMLSVQIIWVMTGIIVYEACQRLYHGIHIVDGRLVFAVACVELVLNLIMIFVLGHAHECNHGGHSHGHGHSHCSPKDYDNDHDHDHIRTPNPCGDIHAEQVHQREPGSCYGYGYSNHFPKEHNTVGVHDNLGSYILKDKSGSGRHERHMHDEEHCKCKDRHLAGLNLDQSGDRGSLGSNHGIGSIQINLEQVEVDHLLPDKQRTPKLHHLNDSGCGIHHVDIDKCHQLSMDTSRGNHCQMMPLNPNADLDRSPLGDAMLSLRTTSTEEVFEVDFPGVVGQMSKISKPRSRNINLRGAYLHALGDLIQNIGVLISGLVIWIKPEWQFIDLVCSFLFSILVMITTIKMVKDIVWVLLESAAKELDVEQIKGGLMQISGVTAVLDLHVWALTPGTNLLSCHIEITPGVLAKTVLRNATEYCVTHHHIKHVTIQIEDGLEDTHSE